ncbi:hypothetical protein FGADI_9095 [Fusarium gaditjirri]|uniref:Aldehyde dehydrogenase domain-containing protein n=1 Tax=Fusarium gaditjirri TaxID=282569 RepID=A0A8H4T0W0_9HYPO|nr:hypothetical protein FGADI_9095 [Fusarium gaditjirri]
MNRRRRQQRHLRGFSPVKRSIRSDITKIIAAESGKAEADAEGKVMFSVGFCEWFTEEAPRLFGDVIPHSLPNSRIQAIKHPGGVCSLMTPWNFPLAMAARKVAAALASRCTVVLLMDEVTPFSGNVLVVLTERAGLPKGALSIVTALDSTPKLGLPLCESDVVKKISFTGSTRSTRRSSCLPRDVETAVSCVVVATFKVTGQTCVCANRIYVPEGIYNQFAKRLVEESGKFKVGNEADASVPHGPLTTGVDKIEDQVKGALKKKATIPFGGQRLPDLAKNFFQPTVLCDVEDMMVVTYDETFGPLAALTKFRTEDKLTARANNPDERLEFVMVAISTGVISAWADPFGGVQHSDKEHEGSKYAVVDYMVLKTIVTGAHTSAKPHLLLSKPSFRHPSYRHDKSNTSITSISAMATEKMKSSPLKPSTPIAIPTGRNRARTVDHLPRHHPPSHSSILSQSPGPQRHSDAVPPDPRKTTNPKDPLRYVDSLKLQVVRDKHGKTLGLKVIDINSVKPEIANVCAHIPIGKENSGLVFDVESAEAMKELYSKASLTMASDRIMGILFAPPGPDAGGIARDADWSFLDDDVGGGDEKHGNEDRDWDRTGANTQIPLLLRGLDLD